MTTRDIVPRADGEGEIGTTEKMWLGGHFKTLYTNRIENEGSGDTPDYLLSSYASWAAAISSIGSTVARLIVDTDATVSADSTTPSTLMVRVLPGCIITIATTKTLTMNGPLDAGLYQVFSCTGTGKVVFGSGVVVYIYPQWWGCTGDAVTDDSTAIQSAITTADASLGGTILFPVGRYNLSTTGITLTNMRNVQLKGVSQSYTSSTRGVEFLYSGTGSAILCTSVLNNTIEDISVDATDATGTDQRGIYLKGAWLTTLRNVRVKGIENGDGYGILIDTNAGAWGGQHNLLERIECADGIIRIVGTSGADEVTTTVMNTIRGFQYEIAYATVVAINCTAEGWTTGAGWTWTGAGTYGLMLGCDVEGNGTPGISIDGDAVVQDIGTIWAGFTGTDRYSGYNTAHSMYGGGWYFTDIPTAGNLFDSAINWNNFAQFLVRANNVTGGAQDGNIELKRFVAGTQMNQFEWKNQFKLEHSKSTANSATTVLTVPIGSVGARIKVTARGTEPAAGAYCATREAVAVNNAGTVTVTMGTALTVAAGGAAPVITFTVSSTNILVQFNHASATPSTSTFIIEIDGDVTSYTKG